MAIGETNQILSRAKVVRSNFNLLPRAMCVREESTSVDVLLVGLVLHTVIEQMISCQNSRRPITLTLVGNGEAISLGFPILE